MLQKKICLLGSPAVGKTSLVAQYVHQVFSETYLTTVGVKIDKKEVVAGDRKVLLLVWDLHGDDEFQRLQESYLRGTHAYFLVADGTRRDTLEHALELQQRFQATLNGIPFMTLLNKADLTRQWELDQGNLDELQARGWEFQETSARTGKGVESAFRRLAEMSLQS
ncbi:MAG: GTP-binding protein [Planctomycetota bacterium]|nr:MAG: GTP-binding protein [Planctomycetota bacterium]